MTDLHARRAATRARAQGSLEAARAALALAIQLARLVLETDPDPDAHDAIGQVETAAADLSGYLRRAPQAP